MISSTLLWLVFRGFGLIPLSLRYKFAWLAGTIFSWIPTRDRLIAELQLDIFLGPGSAKKYLRDVYLNLAYSIAEAPSLNKIVKRGAVTVVPQHSLDTMRAESGARLLLSTHLSNWELVGAFMASEIPLSVIGREMRSPAVQSLISRIRSDYQARTLWRGGRLGIKQIISDLDSGRWVAALIDQDTDVGGMPNNFFGHPAKTPTAIVDLALRRKIPIYTAMGLREPNGNFTIYIDKLDNFQTRETALDGFHQKLERLIRKSPGQWVWFHKRWRSVPGRDRLSSREYLAYLRELHAKQK